MRHGIAQHVLERRHHLVEHRAVEFHLATNDIQVGALAEFLGGLANDAEQPFSLAGERRHADTHQLLLQPAIQARLRDDGGIGIIKVPEQVLLHGRHIVDRLSHKPRQFLEARETVQFERVEVLLAVLGLGDARLHLTFGLDFDFAQLPTQTDDILSEIQE